MWSQDPSLQRVSKHGWWGVMSASLCFWNVLGVQINDHVRVSLDMKADHEALLPEE